MKLRQQDKKWKQEVVESCKDQNNALECYSYVKQNDKPGGELQILQVYLQLYL